MVGPVSEWAYGPFRERTVGRTADVGLLWGPEVRANGLERGGDGPLFERKRSPAALGVGPIVGMRDGHPFGEEGPSGEEYPFGEECPFGEEGPLDEVSASFPG